jgi:hypothetical protein
MTKMTKTVLTETARRPLLSYLTAAGGGLALLLGVLGCLLYLVFWSTLDPQEQFGIVAGTPGVGSARRILLVPRLINYLSLVLCLTTFALGTVAMIREDKDLWAEVGLVVAGAAFCLLLLLWIWTVTRSPADYLQYQHPERW